MTTHNTDPEIPVLRLRCTDESSAQLFEAWLRNEGVDTKGTDGTDTLVPTNNPLFAWDLAEAANDNGFAHDGEACASVRRFFEEVGFRG